MTPSDTPLPWKLKPVDGDLKKDADDHQAFWVSVPSDQIYLLVKRWEPTGKPKATVTFIHGVGEHIMRYEHVFTRFAANGIRTLAFDQRGHGRTLAFQSMHASSQSMVMGDNQGMQSVMDDIYRACQTDVEGSVRLPGIPHFLMGHSMGGYLVIEFAVRYGKDVGLAGVISSAPALRPGFHVPYLKKVLGSWLSRVMGSFNIPTEIDVNQISRDPKVIEAYKQDPYVHGFGSLRTLAGILDGGEKMFNETYKKWNSELPLLMSFGSKDGLTSFETGQEFMEKLMCTDKTFQSYEGCYHELHNEPEQDKVIQAYIDWILKHI